MLFSFSIFPPFPFHSILRSRYRCTHSAQFLSRIFIHFEAVQERFKSVDRSECVLEQHSPSLVEFADIHHSESSLHHESTRLHTESNPSLQTRTHSIYVRQRSNFSPPPFRNFFLFQRFIMIHSWIQPSIHPSFCNFPLLRKLFEECKVLFHFFFFLSADLGWTRWY